MQVEKTKKRSRRKSLTIPPPIEKQLEELHELTGRDRCAIIIDALSGYLNAEIEKYLNTRAKKVVLGWKDSSQKQEA